MSVKRSFTTRIPIEMYVEIGDLALGEGIDVNSKVNQLLRLGLEKHRTLETVVRNLLINHEYLGEPSK